MFCPTCGRDNLKEQKFCASCGTNLEVVSQALSGTATNFFTRLDSSLDQFNVRYSEHVFKDSPSYAGDRSVRNSWRLLGRGVVTSLVDLFLSIFLWNFFVLRFHVLWISTPFRLLSERSNRLKSWPWEHANDPQWEAYFERRLDNDSELHRSTLKAGINTGEPLALPEQKPCQFVAGAIPSVSEHTTEHLQEYVSPSQRTFDEN